MKKKRDKDSLAAVAEAVKAFRHKAEMTQEDVAFAAGISVRHYQSLESGNLNPSLLSLQSVAQALGVPLSKIVAELERTTSNTSTKRR